MANTKETGTSVKVSEADSPAGRPAFSLDDLASGKIVVNPGWLNEVWSKWPGDEPIEELLTALDDH